MKRSRLRPVSAKQAARNRNLAKLRTEILEERGPWCAGPRYVHDFPLFIPGEPSPFDALLDGCTGRGTEMHHVVKRSRRGEDRKEDLVLLCSSCHRFTEEQVALATEIGLLRTPSLDPEKVS